MTGHKQVPYQVPYQHLAVLGMDKLKKSPCLDPKGKSMSADDRLTEQTSSRFNEQTVMAYLQKRAAARASEGAAIQLGFAVLLQDIGMGTDLGGPTPEMIALAEQVIEESLQELIAAAMAECGYTSGRI